MGSEEVTLVGITITFLVGILNFIYSLINNKKTRFINTVTSARVKWIDNLRNNISEYISLIPMNEVKYIEIFDQRKEFIEKFTKSSLLITLMLNKNDSSDEKLINNLNYINKKNNEIMKCVELLNFFNLKGLKDLHPKTKHETKIRLIKKLDTETKILFKNEILLRIGKQNSEFQNIEPEQVIIEIETREFGIKRDAYITCIYYIHEELKEEVNRLTENLRKLLKKEWDRVKEESKVGEYNTSTKKNLS